VLQWKKKDEYAERYVPDRREEYGETTDVVSSKVSDQLAAPPLAFFRQRFYKQIFSLI